MPDSNSLRASRPNFAPPNGLSGKIYMNKTTNDYISIYKSQLQQGDIQIAYKRLFEFIGFLKASFQSDPGDQWSFGNISPGYMDYTYFPFFNEYLRGKKLRFGIVLNHRHMRFELWLMGQNAEVQKQYWNILKSTKWNEGRSKMPQYSVLEAVLVEAPDFNNFDILSAQVQKTTASVLKEIMELLM